MTLFKIDQLENASKLIYKGLNAKATPDKDNEYKKLIAKFEADELFRDQIDAIAKGLELKVVDVSYEAGAIILPLDQYSAFCFGGLEKLRKTLGKNTDDGSVKRGAMVLTIIALLATFFRDEVQFREYKQAQQTQTLHNISHLLLDICESLQARYHEDQEDIPEYLRQGWEIILNLPQIKEGQATPNSVEGLIEILTTRFIDEGLLVKDQSRYDEKAWFPTQRFIAQMERETATGIYEYCLRIYREQRNKQQNEAESE